MTSAATNHDAVQKYEDQITEVRSRLAEGPEIRALTAAECDTDLFALWMLRYSAHGVHMTHDVERWIATAGERCGELGMEALATALSGHARAEAGHDRMMVADARALSSWLDADRGVRIDVDALLAAPPLASSRDYIELHERVTKGDQPWCQLAIELEIEQLSTTFGPEILKNSERLLPVGTYTFLAEHVELDVGHTAFNRRQLGGVLKERPEALPSMVETATRALECYAAFITECWRLAGDDLRRAGGSQ
ncbi:iron-containing redox enzyme family protein [Streptomyces sp. NPDC002088]|uniref:iron-containing redox enzyme family protein n=1 Tax=Streptomyces sp. NPDC002088 TaxID=3154665 RepID=UPI00331ACE47